MSKRPRAKYVARPATSRAGARFGNEMRGPLEGNHQLDGFLVVTPFLIPCLSHQQGFFISQQKVTNTRFASIPAMFRGSTIYPAEARQSELAKGKRESSQGAFWLSQCLVVARDPNLASDLWTAPSRGGEGEGAQISPHQAPNGSPPLPPPSPSPSVFFHKARLHQPVPRVEQAEAEAVPWPSVRLEKIHKRHQLGWMKPYESWGETPNNWCRKVHPQYE